MSCYSPLTAYRMRGGALTFIRQKSLTQVPFQVPCGQCIGCRLEKSRQWAMRCMHEAKLSTASSFITLTYDNQWLPPGGSLSKSAFQLFMKRLRKARGAGLRFYACGEYGDLNARPHYHALLFNCEFPDRRKVGVNSRGEILYASEELRRYWPYGNNIIGDVTFDSAAYVARYVTKKVTGDKAEDHYSVIDGDGVVYDRLPEFALMSRRPGIGAGYYDKFGNEVRDHDSVVVNGRLVNPPRFYDTRTEKLHPATYQRIKKARRKQAALLKDDNTPERLRVKEELAIKTFKLKKREL